MSQITQTIHRKLYTYKKSEFMPIWREGRLDNRGEFIRYKLGQAASWCVEPFTELSRNK